MKLKLLNAFSLNMLSHSRGSVIFEEVPLIEAQAALSLKGYESSVGHTNTAAVFSSELGMKVPVSRTTVTLNKGDQAVVGQYRGPRLEEGATTLPEGATIVWYLLLVM